MTLLEFIKSKLKENGKLGDFAKKIQRDSQFPAGKSDKEIITYLYFKARSKVADQQLRRLIQEFNKQKKTLDVGNRFNSKSNELYSDK